MHMKPWFLKEGEVIDFPKKDDKVIKLPSVDHYDSFFAGVKDLQAQLEQGDITKTIYDKLYQDLIHRFAKKESAETPWFLREAPEGIMSIPVSKEIEQVKQMLLKQIKNEQELAVLKKILKVMKDAGIDDKIAKVLKTDQDAKPIVQRLVADIMNTEGTVAEKEHFANNYTKGFINLDAILTPNQKISTRQILQNEMPPDPNNKEQKQTSFVSAVFDFIARNYAPQGVGPGEVALAVLSPNILRVGGGKESIGDIKVSHNGKDYYVEMKGKNYNPTTKKSGTSGRLADAKVHFADPTAMSNTLKSINQTGQRISLSPSKSARVAVPLVGNENSVVAKYAKAGGDVNAFAKNMAKALFSKVPGMQAQAQKLIASNDGNLMMLYTRTLYNRYYELKSKEGDKKLSGFFFINMRNNSFYFSTNFDALTQANPNLAPVYITDPAGGPVGDARELGTAITL